jgi:hypothetical protein
MGTTGYKRTHCHLRGNTPPAAIGPRHAAGLLHPPWRGTRQMYRSRYYHAAPCKRPAFNYPWCTVRLMNTRDDSHRCQSSPAAADHEPWTALGRVSPDAIWGSQRKGLFPTLPRILQPRPRRARSPPLPVSGTGRGRGVHACEGSIPHHHARWALDDVAHLAREDVPPLVSRTILWESRGRWSPLVSRQACGLLMNTFRITNGGCLQGAALCALRSRRCAQETRDA